MAYKKNTYQAYNDRIDAWVKYKFGESGFIPLDVKQRNPQTPFKNIKKRGKRR
jgi:hypothetical protein